MSLLLICSITFSIYILFVILFLFVKKKISSEKGVVNIVLISLLISFLLGIVIMGIALSV